ncbi:MAG: hypothetical protein WBG22_10380 [Rhodanobacter sp.]
MKFKFSKQGLRSFFERVPVLGHLVHCTKTNHADSIKEFLPSIAFSTATFWLTAIFLLALKSNAKQDFFDMLISTANSGELLIFSLAFLGSIIVSAAEDPASARVFPGRAWHFFVVFSVALVAAGFYALIKVSDSSNTQNLYDSAYILRSSGFISIVAVFLAYLTLVYRKQTFDPDKEMKEPEVDFADDFARSVQK